MASFGASSPGSSVATAAKYDRPSEGLPSAKWSTPRHHAARQPLSRASCESSSRLATSNSPSSIADRARLRLSSGDRGIVSRSDWRWSAPSERRGGEHAGAGSDGSTAGTGRNCHGLSSGDAPSSELKRVLGAAAGTATVGGNDLAEHSDQLLRHLRGRLEPHARVGVGRLLQEAVEGLVALEHRYVLKWW